MINLLLISVFLSSIAMLGLCIFSYLAGNRYKTFIVFNVNIVVFYLFYGLSIVASDYQSALTYTKINISLSYFISLLSQFFAAEFSSIRHKKYLLINSVITVTLVIITAFSSYFVYGVGPFMDFTYSVQTTDLFKIIYFPYFLVNVVYSHYLIWKTRNRDPKAKYIFTALFCGYAGGCTIMFQYYAIEIYPSGNFLVVFYAFLMAYGITKYRFFNSSLIISKFITKLAALITLAICYLVLYVFYYLLFPVKSNISDIILHISFLIFACETYKFFVSKFYNIQKRLLKVEFRVFNNVLEEIKSNLSHKNDMAQINHFINELFYYKIPLELRLIAINENNCDNDKADPNYQITLNPDDITKCSLTKFYNEISTLENTTCYQDASSHIKTLLDISNASSLVPFMYHKEVVGFLLVKQRDKNHFFTHEDIMILDKLSYHIGLAIGNVKTQHYVSKESQDNNYITKNSTDEMQNPLRSINMLGSHIKEILHNNHLSSSSLGATTALEADKPNEEVSHILRKYRRNKNALSELTSKISDSIYLANNIINIILGDLKDQTIHPQDLEFLNLRYLISDIIDKYGYKSAIEKKAVMIDHNSFKNERGNDQDIFIKAVRERLTFTIYNILKNALIYMNDYENLKIVISLDEQKEDQKEYIIIHITDYNGPGISQKNIDKIFEDFFTTKESDKGSSKGSGLGLAFCQRNMQLFGGHIKCESKINEFTKFSLYFPKPSKAEIDNIDNYKKQKILLINQDDQTRQIIEDNLEIICDQISSSDANLGNIIFRNSYKLIIFCESQDQNSTNNDILLKHLKSARNINKECAIIVHNSNCYEDFSNAYKKLLHYYINHQEDPNYNILLRTISKLTAPDPNKEIDLSYIKEEKNDLKKHKIMFADDNEINLRVTKNSFENIGLNVTTATNGRELIDIFKQDLESQVKNKKMHSSFSLILTDINMPYIEGNKAAKEIRKIEQKLNVEFKNQIPIIVTTGNIVNADAQYYESEEDNIFNYFETGVNDYFLKGNDPNSLTKLLKVYLGARSFP